MGTNKQYNGCLVWQTNSTLSFYEYVDGTSQGPPPMEEDVVEGRVPAHGQVFFQCLGCRVSQVDGAVFHAFALAAGQPPSAEVDVGHFQVLQFFEGSSVS